MIDDGNQPFVPPMPSFDLQANRLEREIQVIMDNDHIFNGYLEKVGKPSDREAAPIHVCLRLGEQHGTAGYFPPTDFGIKQGLTDGYEMLLCQLIQDQETRVVPVQLIPDSRVSQSDNTFHTKTSRTGVGARYQKLAT